MRYRVDLEELLAFVKPFVASSSAPKPSPLVSTARSPICIPPGRAMRPPPTAKTTTNGLPRQRKCGKRTRKVLSAVNDLTLAMENYGGVVIQAGHNHAIAEYDATSGGGPPPDRPPEPRSIAGMVARTALGGRPPVKD